MNKENLSKWQKTAEILKQSFDEKECLFYEQLRGANYHSARGEGRAYRTVRNAEYVVMLLAEGGDANIKTAETIIRKLLDHQDTNPNNSTFGVWPYYFEEPIESMINPDWNWACFIGRILIVIQNEFSDLLDEQMQSDIKLAVQNACRCVLSRNLGVDYTNIVLMSAFVLIAGGELIGDDEVYEKGVDLLERELDFVRKNGGYIEYNSPTYGMIDIEESGRILYYCKDVRVQAVARALHDEAWKVYLEHYHLPTGQLAGPHSRCYSDLQALHNPLTLTNTSVYDLFAKKQGAIPSLLQIGTGTDIFLDEQDIEYNILWPFMTLECPKEYLDLLDKEVIEEDYYREHDPLTSDELRVHIEKGLKTLSSYTYRTNDYCLGTFNRHDLWNQRRPLVASLKTDVGFSVFRVRCMHDEMDFASGLCTNVQHKNVVAGGLSLVKDHGDYHFILTQMDDCSITTDKFFFEFSLVGDIKNSSITKNSDSEYRFKTGKNNIDLQILANNFNETEMESELIETDELLALRFYMVNSSNTVLKLDEIEKAYLLYKVSINEPSDTSNVDIISDNDSSRLQLTFDNTVKTTQPIVHRPTTFIDPPCNEEKGYRKGGFYYK